LTTIVMPMKGASITNVVCLIIHACPLL
jgi:hypothetical protein